MSDSPAMINAPRLCRKCGAEIPSDAPEGGCLGCLLQAGFGVLPETLGAARDASTVTSTKADAAAAGQSEKSAGSAETLGELGDYELLEVVGRGASKHFQPQRAADFNYCHWSQTGIDKNGCEIKRHG